VARHEGCKAAIERELRAPYLGPKSLTLIVILAPLFTRLYSYERVKNFF